MHFNLSAVIVKHNIVSGCRYLLQAGEVLRCNVFQIRTTDFNLARIIPQNNDIVALGNVFQPRIVSAGDIIASDIPHFHLVAILQCDELGEERGGEKEGKEDGEPYCFHNRCY